MIQTKFFLARHAKAQHNVYDKPGLFAGGQKKSDFELTEDGKLAAEELTENIIALGGCDLIVASSMKRSQQTAHIIATKLESMTNAKVPVITIKEFKEIDVGGFTAKSEKYVKAHFPRSASDFYKGNIEEWNFPNGESYPALLVRIKAAFKKLLEISAGHRQVVVVGHSMLNRVIIHQLLPRQKDLWEMTAYPHDRIIELKNVDKI